MISIYQKVENGKVIFCDDDEKEVILSEVHLIRRSEKVKSPIREMVMEEIEYEIAESEDEKPDYENEYYCISDDDDEYYAYDNIIHDEI